MKPQTLRLHRRLYSRAAIDATTEAFAEICSVKLELSKDHYVLEIDDIDPDVGDALVPELANYALAEVVERRR